MTLKKFKQLVAESERFFTGYREFDNYIELYGKPLEIKSAPQEKIAQPLYKSPTVISKKTIINLEDTISLAMSLYKYTIRKRDK